MRIPIEKFQEQGGRLKTDDLDFESFRTQPLSPDVLRCLGYMHDIEYQTVLYTFTPDEFEAFVTGLRAKWEADYEKEKGN